VFKLLPSISTKASKHTLQWGLPVKGGCGEGLSLTWGSAGGSGVHSELVKGMGVHI